jgi:hypothetical protein
MGYFLTACFSRVFRLPVAEEVGVTSDIIISVSDGIAPPVALAAFDLRVAEGFHKALYADPGVSSIAGSVSIRSASAPMIIPPGLPTDRRLPWINL